MKIVATTIGVMLGIASGALYAQDSMQAAIDRHTSMIERTSNPQAVFSSIQRDVRNAGPEYFELDEQDARRLARILEIDRPRVEREAISQYMQEICESVDSGSSDIAKLAFIFSQSIAEEERAVENALRSVLVTLSDDGFEKVDAVIKSRTTEKSYRIVNWVGLAQEEPDSMRRIIFAACERFERSEERRISNLENSPLENTGAQVVNPGIKAE